MGFSGAILKFWLYLMGFSYNNYSKYLNMHHNFAHYTYINSFLTQPNCCYINKTAYG